jgi:hypothetical protein
MRCEVTITGMTRGPTRLHIAPSDDYVLVRRHPRPHPDGFVAIYGIGELSMPRVIKSYPGPVLSSIDAAASPYWDDDAGTALGILVHAECHVDPAIHRTDNERLTIAFDLVTAQGQDCTLSANHADATRMAVELLGTCNDLATLEICETILGRSEHDVATNLQRAGRLATSGCRAYDLSVVLDSFWELREPPPADGSVTDLLAWHVTGATLRTMAVLAADSPGTLSLAELHHAATRL